MVLARSLREKIRKEMRSKGMRSALAVQRKYHGIESVLLRSIHVRIAIHEICRVRRAKNCLLDFPTIPQPVFHSILLPSFVLFYLISFLFTSEVSSFLLTVS